MKKIFCCPALELFHCLPLWKTVLFVSSRAFSLSTPPCAKQRGYMEKGYKMQQNKSVYLYRAGGTGGAGWARFWLISQPYLNQGEQILPTRPQICKPAANPVM